MKSMENGAEIVLRADSLSKKIAKTEILRGISFELHRGEILSFIGPNGAGKTTLLKILSGFLTSDSGEILFEDKKVTNQLDKLNSLVSTVFGGGSGFYRSATVLENLNFFAVLFGLNKKTRVEKVSQVIEAVQLTDHQNKLASQLSMGLLQRLHIARGLLKNSPILLLDEPTNGVDAEMSQEIRKIVKNIADLM